MDYPGKLCYSATLLPELQRCMHIKLSRIGTTALVTEKEQHFFNEIAYGRSWKQGIAEMKDSLGGLCVHSYQEKEESAMRLSRHHWLLLHSWPTSFSRYYCTPGHGCMYIPGSTSSSHHYPTPCQLFAQWTNYISYDVSRIPPVFCPSPRRSLLVGNFLVPQYLSRFADSLN